jgi:hypothetical protein
VICVNPSAMYQVKSKIPFTFCYSLAYIICTNECTAKSHVRQIVRAFLLPNHVKDLESNLVRVVVIVVGWILILNQIEPLLSLVAGLYIGHKLFLYLLYKIISHKRLKLSMRHRLLSTGFSLTIWLITTQPRDSLLLWNLKKRHYMLS